MTDTLSKLATSIKQAPSKSKGRKAESPGTQPQAQAERRLGRPRNGKRSDPGYRQVSAWVRRDTYKTVQDRLFPARQEFSDLVQELLEKWLKKP